MKAVILIAKNSGENLQIIEYDSIKKAKKNHRLSNAQTVHNVHVPQTNIVQTVLFTLSKNNAPNDILDSYYIEPGNRKLKKRVFCFYDPSLCSIEAK